MTTQTRSHLDIATSLRRTGITLFFLAFGGMASPLLGQEAEDEKSKNYTAIRASAADAITVSTNGRVSLTLTNAPRTSSEAKLHILNSAGYPLWTGDLDAQSNTWIAQFDREAAEALLISRALHAEFPNAASDGKNLRISMVHDDYFTKISNIHALLGSAPVFYESPEAPDAVTVPENATDSVGVGAYAAAALRYDEEIGAYQDRMRAAMFSAQALWTDLNTANRLPDWPDAVINAQKRAFESLEQEINGVGEKRKNARSKAAEIVRSWNAANPDKEPIKLDFREMS
ncbi:MAG: hypothetical protein SynsKO_19840 [Synoicihabitans sp.]